MKLPLTLPLDNMVTRPITVEASVIILRDGRPVTPIGPALVIWLATPQEVIAAREWAALQPGSTT
jgi:hypothetical protein